MSKKNRKKDEIDYKDLYTRTVADFQNYKRRIKQERAGWMSAAQGETIAKLLSVIDDLNRAISFAEKSADQKRENRVLEGLELMKKNVDKVFADLGVTEIDCSGEFNPDFHEAMVQVDSKENKSGEIVEVISRGYVLNDHVIRHAQVSVAK